MAPRRAHVTLGGLCSIMHIRSVFRTGFAALLAILIVSLALAACGTSSTTTSTPEQPLLAKDTNGTTITIPSQAPQHIVSLGPTDSEILAALGAGSRVVAVDYYTDYPTDFAAKQKITDSSGTASVEAIVALKPDLVLSYGGETRATDQKLLSAHIAVVDLPQLDLTGSLMEMRLVGQLIHAESQADSLVANLQKRIDAVKNKAASAQPISVYMEADYSTPGKPFVFGGGSFGDELIRDAGGTNIFGSTAGNGGYPQVSDETVIAAKPLVIILTEDPNYGGQPQLVYQRRGWSSVPAVESKRVYAITPDLVQRAGPRLVDGLEQLAKLLHPELFS
ncbi:MAG: ABC transporter substrate-binding protein [Ktedonobacterales bacterium]